MAKTVLFKDYEAYNDPSQLLQQLPGTNPEGYVKFTYSDEAYAEYSAGWPEHLIVTQDGDDVKIANCSL